MWQHITESDASQVRNSLGDIRHHDERLVVCKK